MSAIITVFHIIICAILIVAILLQSGKSADLAGAFGGGGSQTAFGGRGTATLMSKVTTICAVLFMVTSLGLWILSDRGAKSVVKSVDAPKQEAPAAAAEPKKESPTPTVPQKTDEKQPVEQQQKQPPAPKKEAVPVKKG